MAFYRLDSVRRWITSKATARAMTARQIYGAILLQAAPAGETKEARIRRILEARSHIESAPIRHGILMADLASGYGWDQPIDEKKRAALNAAALPLLRNPPDDADAAVRAIYFLVAHSKMTEEWTDLKTPLPTLRKWAIEAAEKSAEAFRESGQPSLHAFMLSQLAQSLMARDDAVRDIPRARTLYDQAASIFRKENLPRDEAGMLRFVGLLYQPDRFPETGCSWQRSAAAYARAAELFDQLKQREDMLSALRSQAECLEEGKLFEPGRRISDETRKVIERLVKLSSEAGDKEEAERYRKLLDRQ